MERIIVFDTDKYGLKLDSISEDGFMYRYFAWPIKEVKLDVAIVFDGTVTVCIVQNPNDEDGYNIMYVANRYKCETQEQFDFLLMNGRAGFWFKELQKQISIPETK